MQRRFCMKLFSKIPQIANSISQKQKPLFLAPSLKTNANPFHQQSLTKHSTFSRSNHTHNGLFAILKTHSVNSRRLLIHSRRNFHSFDSHYSGWRSYLRRLTPNGVVIGLCATNVAVYMLWRIADHRFMVENFMVSVDNFTSGRYHTLITSAFSHRDVWHLITNMVGLYFFGTSIGSIYGPQYLLKLYFSGAIVGSIFYLAYHAFIAPSFQNKYMLDHSRIPGLGASGAVNAIMLLDIFLNPTKTILFDFFIPIPAILLGIYVVGRDIMMVYEGNSDISGSAHLGGATVAAIAWARSRRGRFFRRF